MPYTGDKYVGDLALYYIAKKLESGQKSGSVKNAVDDVDIDSQLTGAKVNTKTGEILDMATEMGLVEKSGAWYSHDGDRIGQGRENAKIFLKDNPGISSKIEEKIREKGKKCLHMLLISLHLQG